jgi:uncharacterized membrane protein
VIVLGQGARGFIHNFLMVAIKIIIKSLFCCMRLTVGIIFYVIFIAYFTTPGLVSQSNAREKRKENVVESNAIKRTSN